MAQKVQVIQETGQLRRQLRTPRHSFNVSFTPWQIQPFMVAPVLPGETMANLLLQGSLRSDAVWSDQLGWWVENYFFYVKHRDIAQRDLITQMHLDPTTNVDALRNPGPGFSRYGAYPGAIDWGKLAVERIVEEYFRDEGEGIHTFSIGGMPIASMNIKNFMESAIFDSDSPASDHELPGENPSLPDQGIPAGFESAWEHWQAMRAMRLTEATFEDYLKSFGVSPAKELQVEEIHRPELIRYIREWSLPQVKYDPTTKGAAPQLVASLAERADKDRFFAEPGFIVGLVCVRPKMYVGQIKGIGAGMLDNAYTWLPAVLGDEPYTSLKKFSEGEGPVPTAPEDYWVDVKDLFMHGDEFKTDLGFIDEQYGLLGGTAPPPDLGGDGGGDGGGGGDPPLGIVAGFEDVPSALVAQTEFDLKHRFATAAAYDQLFRNPGRSYVRYEGVVSLSVKSRLRDTSL